MVWSRRLRKDIEKITKKNVVINVEEVKIPEIDAQLVAENIACST